MAGVPVKRGIFDRRLLPYKNCVSIFSSMRSTYLSFQNQFIILGGAISAGAGGKNLHQPPPFTGMFLDLFLVMISGRLTCHHVSLAETYEFVLKSMHHHSLSYIMFFYIPSLFVYIHKEKPGAYFCARCLRLFNHAIQILLILTNSLIP